MSFFNWFTARKPRHSVPLPKSTRRDATRPASLATAPQPLASGGSMHRKHERVARRELLFTVVREAMVRAGVLSSSYKFKVLSLDGAGHQFLVMVDVAAVAADPVRMAQIEAAITRVAKTRHHLDVQAVYWRTTDAIRLPQAQADAQAEAQARMQPQEPQPSMDAAASRPADLQEPTRGPGGRYEPLHASEVTAFQQALARGMAARSAPAPRKQPAQNYGLLTGFEDTEFEGAQPKGQLSATQYGELR